MAIAEAYFDESGSHEDSPFLVVAGYLFERGAAELLAGEWRAMFARFALPFFRMSSCAHGNGAFEGMSKELRLEVEKLAIALIKKYMTFGAAVSVDMKHAHLLPRTTLYEDPYSFVCWYALMAVRRWAAETNFVGDVAYFFESGHKSQGKAATLMDDIFFNEELREAYRYASHAFADKAKLPRFNVPIFLPGTGKPACVDSREAKSVTEQTFTSCSSKPISSRTMEKRRFADSPRQAMTPRPKRQDGEGWVGGSFP